MTQPLRRLVFGTAPDTPPPAAVSPQEMAALVRTLYCAAYRNASPAAADYGNTHIPRWDGGIDRADGRAYQPVWPKLASFMLANGVEPASFIQAQFAHRRGLRPPTPTMMYSAKALERYEAYRALELPLIVADWTRQKESLDLRIRELRRNHPEAEEWRIITTALHDQQQVSASSLFRYCAAVRCNLPAVASHFFRAALAEYAFQAKQLDAAVGAQIPQALREEAAAMMRSVILGKDETHGA